MSQQRKMPRGHDLYLEWHRSASLQRFVGRQRAQWMSLIDVDCCEYCHLGGCYQPVALIETKLIWSASKATTVTENLARDTRSGVGAFLVEYEPARDPIVCHCCGRPDEHPDDDIALFWVTDLLNSGEQKQLEPAEYAEWLWELRFPHWRQRCRHLAASRMLAWQEAA